MLKLISASRRVVVCELEDLRREILLVEARLKIADETKVRKLCIVALYDYLVLT